MPPAEEEEAPSSLPHVPPPPIPPVPEPLDRRGGPLGADADADADADAAARTTGGRGGTAGATADAGSGAAEGMRALLIGARKCGRLIEIVLRILQFLKKRSSPLSRRVWGRIVF
mmetsp:Transcript_17726/g.51601  ORF Transcript_17726/g.51601 Transcript_17726/m.51601 type:complete len:115 (-) Transcript_17726:275-619(-)